MELARDNEGELGECRVTRCKQQDGLLQERGEGICPLEADRDEVGPGELCEVERASAANGYTWSLGGMETPGALVVAQIPRVNVPVCVFTSVAKCVLKSTHSVGERLCVRKTACVGEIASVGEKECLSEKPCVRKTTCVREKVCVDETPCVCARVCV